MLSITFSTYFKEFQFFSVSIKRDFLLLVQGVSENWTKFWWYGVTHQNLFNVFLIHKKTCTIIIENS